MLRTLISILILCFLALGTGTAEYLHDRAHDADDKAADLAAIKAGRTPIDHPEHDESNCPVHFALHMPAISITAWVPLLVCLGLLIAFLTELPARLPRRQTFVWIDCRGPPALVCAI